jgi:hypothetical protein
VTAGTLELGTDFNQLAATSGASRSRLVLVTFVFVLLHWFPSWLDYFCAELIRANRSAQRHFMPV